MNSIVIYATRYGNTRKVAEAIASALQSYGSAQALPAEQAHGTLPEGTDLVVIGGPTEVHHMTDPIAQLLSELGPQALTGKAAAAFDTRLDWPRWLSGSAAVGIAQKLRASGARVIAPTESFIVTNVTDAAGARSAALNPDELGRAERWATTLARLVAERAPVTPGVAP